MKTILILSGVPYKFTKQRPQHMAEFFSRQGYKVLYLGFGEKAISVTPHEFDQLTINELLDKYSSIVMKNLFVLNRLLRGTEKKESLNHLILKINNSVTPENLVVFVEHPDWLEHVTSIDTGVKLIYDCIDDWEGFATDLNWGIKNSISHKERKLAGIADLVLTSAKRLYARMCLFNNNVYYLPNGVLNTDYSKNENLSYTPEDVRDIKGPIILFMGGVAGWVDLDLISFISQQRQNYSLVFIGDIVGCKLPKGNNIHFLGKKEYKDLASYLMKAKVAIIPFKETNLTASVTPLKYYEYMSAGVPVVSTMLPDLVHLPGSKVVRDYNGFLDAIDYFVHLNEHDYEKASALAKETVSGFDWNSLLQPLCHYIDGNEELFKIPVKETFIKQTALTYEGYSKNNIIKNELLSFYNLQQEYNKTVLLFTYEELVSGTLSVDYNQIALAYYMIGEIEKSIELAKLYVRKSKKAIWHSKYFDSLVAHEELLFKSFLLKICGRHYEALSIIDFSENTPMTAGMLSSIYIEIAEYGVALDYSVQALENRGDRDIDEVLDPYFLIDMIDYLISQGEYRWAEQLTLELMGKGEVLEEVAIEKLGEIYLLVNLPEE